MAAKWKKQGNITSQLQHHPPKVAWLFLIDEAVCPFLRAPGSWSSRSVVVLICSFHTISRIQFCPPPKPFFYP
jgi:hypothetical protein